MPRPFPIETETLHTATVRVRIIPIDALGYIAAKRLLAEAITKAAEAHEVSEDWDSKGDQVYSVVFSSDVDRDGVFSAAKEFSNTLAGLDKFKAP